MKWNTIAVLLLFAAVTACSERTSDTPNIPNEADEMSTLPYGSWPSPISAASAESAST